MITRADLARAFIDTADASGFESKIAWLNLTAANARFYAVLQQETGITGGVSEEKAPYEGDALALFAQIEQHHVFVLPVANATGDTSEAAAEFRIAHDICHYLADRAWRERLGKRADFTTEGEMITFHYYFDRLFLIPGNDALPTAMRLTMLQADFTGIMRTACFEETGQFHWEKQFVPVELARMNDWMAQLQLPPLVLA